MYNPTPEDTSNITLSDDILELAEKLAKNTHDVWAISRINEGWKYGEKRDDNLKTTPCLIPYSALPDVEKEYDRKTSIETLKLIIKYGYKIVKEDN